MAASDLSISLLLFTATIIFSNLASLASSSSSICDLTPYPPFCKSNSPSKGRSDIHSYGRFFARKSLLSSTKFRSLVSKYLKPRSKNKLSRSMLLALQDCYLLSDFNVDFWTNTLNAINSTNTLSSSEDENYLHSMISATLTNHDTCLDSLQQATTTHTDELLISNISNGTKFYSISLAFFKQGWGTKKNTHNRKLTERIVKRSNIHRMWEQRLYEITKRRGRKLLQLDPEANVVVSQMVVVNPDGSGDYTTINDAVNAAPNNTLGINGFFVIYVVAGVYEEYVSIPKTKQYLMMIGDGINRTIITGNRSVTDGWTTFNSATFAVVAKGFVAVNMTFRNTAGGINHQAVALRSGADLSAFYSCSFEGYQDTLYTHSMRQFYRNCDIYGTVDFIFGNAAVVFQDCNIYPRLPMSNQFNAITAQGRTDVNQNTGISIHNCTITAAADLAASNGTTKTYLGRPWKLYSRTVYMQSFMDSLIDPAGWVAWSGDFALDTLYYAEYDNWGAGSNTSSRVTWAGYDVLLDSIGAINFTVSNFIFGDVWLPATGVPYLASLY
ncbi:pectinesterase-like [Arachis hypogaea]|uniref:pectinesterase-like n=1 Tax=Arachis hypogaea TaxID=3818 RepID=UPI000DECF529|nr:pectinesterase-like [Arachis hypogaea]QHO45297.1 putative pectinesterase/pectinesterase inhibitor [Arachis hypogaea]